jgi:hypothetical protein
VGTSSDHQTLQEHAIVHQRPATHDAINEAVKKPVFRTSPIGYAVLPD